MMAERLRLKRMKKMAEELPQSETRDATLRRIEVELLYLKLRLNSEY